MQLYCSPFVLHWCSQLHKHYYPLRRHPYVIAVQKDSWDPVLHTVWISNVRLARLYAYITVQDLPYFFRQIKNPNRGIQGFQIIDPDCLFSRATCIVPFCFTRNLNQAFCQILLKLFLKYLHRLWNQLISLLYISTSRPGSVFISDNQYCIMKILRCYNIQLVSEYNAIIVRYKWYCTTCGYPL